MKLIYCCETEQLCPFDFLAVTGIIISAAELVDCICQTVALNGNVIPKIEEKVKINSTPCFKKNIHSYYWL